MKKYIKMCKKRKNKAEIKKKSPDSSPVWGRTIVTIEGIIIFLLRIPYFSFYDFLSTACICVITYMTIVFLWKIYYRKILLGASIKKIDRMTGEEFEEYLALLYKRHGFDVKMTPKTCDFGADLIITNRKTGKKICVQAKRYRGMVGEAAVQQTLSGREYYSCDGAVIITNSHYTDAAKALANKCGIRMIDRFSIGKEQMYCL